MDNVNRMGRPKSGITLRDRIEAKCKILKNGCWQWMGATINVPQNLAGRNLKYGQIKIGKVTHLVHRASWLVYRGPIPLGKKVCHNCDFTLCINPDHLFLGTQKENVADCVSKGRHSHGESDPRSKLTDDIVRKIRAFYKPWDRKRSARAAAAKFKVSQTMAYLVATNKRWKHVKERQ